MERLTERAKSNNHIWCLHDCQERCEDCKHLNSMIEKLAEYEQAEEDGLLIRLPVAEGEEVYVIVQAYTFGEVGDEAEEWYSIHSEKFDRNMVEDFGKTVFLTKAEAEQALAKMKGET